MGKDKGAATFAISVFQIYSPCAPSMASGCVRELLFCWVGRRGSLSPAHGPTSVSCRWAGPFSGLLSGVYHGQRVPSGYCVGDGSRLIVLHRPHGPSIVTFAWHRSSRNFWVSLLRKGHNSGSSTDHTWALGSGAAITGSRLSTQTHIHHC